MGEPVGAQLAQLRTTLRALSERLAALAAFGELTYAQTRKIQQAQAHVESATFLLCGAQDSLLQTIPEPHPPKERIVK